MNKHLMRIVFDLINFLANSEQVQADQEAMAKKFEDVGQMLGKLTEKQQKEFSDFALAQAEKCREEDPQRAAFYESIPGRVGLSS